MNDINNVEWLDQPLVEAREDPELEKWINENAPSVMLNAPYLADCPWMLRADVYLDETYVHITDIASLIYMTVSRDNSCRFCYGAVRLLMRLGGMADAEIVELENQMDTVAAEPRVRLALDYARRVSRANPAPGENERQALRDAGYDDTGIKEIAFQAADVIFHNRMSTLLALPIDMLAAPEEKSVFDSFSELFTKLFKQLDTPSAAENLTEDLKAGPYTNVILALDGIKQARLLRKIIDEAWQSPHLPTVMKLLIFAVIARGLGSRAAETESYRLLAAEGLSPDRVDAIVANLSGPELDENQSQILAYVRETIWYQAPVAQRRGRELRARLTNAQFLETVGIAALANMVCRLPLVLDVAE